MDFKDLFTSRNIIILIIVVILIIAIYYYTKNRRGLEKLTNPDDNTTSASATNMYPTSASGNVPFKTTQTTGIDKPDPSSALPNRNSTTPNDLLPSNSGANWGNLYPVQNNDGSVYVPSLVDPSFSVGINTIGTSLKGQNLDIRSNIAIPKQAVSPWNNSSWEENISKIGLDPSPSTY